MSSSATATIPTPTARGCSSSKFIPVLFDRGDEPYIPEPLRPQTYYVLDSEASYQALYDAILGQSGVEPGPTGELKRKPRPTARPLSFDAGTQPAAGKRPPPPPAACRADNSRILKYAPAQLIGREAAIDQARSRPR